MRVFENIDALQLAAGTELGVSKWVAVTQDVIDGFAHVTGDHQWIHVDVKRAMEGPFSGTIAHGLLVLSLLPALWQEVYEVQGVRMTLNYGFNKVRFISPVPAGSRVRASVHLGEVVPVEGAIQAVTSTAIEIEGVEKPAVIVESVARYIP